ncbi:hypothetical protein KXW05_005745 [Aspergillus fumigatus]|nr:hypothetical protein KXW05_005745 [Aspergillus fumigatus]
MKRLSIDPRQDIPPIRDSPATALPASLPKAKNIKTSPARAGEENASVYFVGNATTIFEWEGLRLMTDPNFLHAGDHVHLGPGVTSTRLRNPAVDLHQLPRIDLVLLSHYHGDHFDQEVEASLRRDLPIITTSHAKSILTSKGADSFQQVFELEPFEQMMVNIKGDSSRTKQPHIRVTGMPGKHIPTNKVVEKLNEFAAAIPPTNGWMVELGYGSTQTMQTDFEVGYRIYISGDTLMVDELKEIPRRFDGQKIDLMLIHLGGTTVPHPKMWPLTMMVTMDAKQGVELVRLIKPDLTIPIHFDDYDVFASSLEDFKIEMQKAGLGGQVVYLDRKDAYRFQHKSPSPAASPAFRSVEQLTIPPPSTGSSPRVPPEDLAFYQRFSDVRLPTSPADPPDNSYRQQPQHEQQQHHPHQLYRHRHRQDHPDHQNHSEHPPPHQPTITRTQSHHSPTLLNSVLATPALPAATHFIDADPADQSSVDRASEQPALAPNAHNSNKQDPLQKSRRKLFGLHSSSSSSSSTGFLERSLSVKGTSSSQSSRQRRHQQQLSLDTQRTHRDRDHQKRTRNINYHSSSETVPEDHVVDPNRSSSQSLLMQQDPASAHQRPPRSPQRPPSIQRSNTDPSLLEKLYSSSPVDSASRQPADPSHVISNQSQTHLQQQQQQQQQQQPQQQSPVSQLQVEPPLSSRPPSRQSMGPPSPLPPFSHQPDPHPSSTHQSGMASSSDRPAGPPQTQPQGHPAFQGGGQQNATESGRSTPPVNSSRRDDLGDIDVRALLQKHDELQAKYSKVKRYYFEKDAQVQQLQNTVAHQRMAVSRTVLDDNEYVNRFARLDGAIKDLAFSIRRDWKSLPTWLAGHVNEDAHATGMKEMTAIGRATMSRWLVEEIFERHFHPALEPNLSMQLKSIEMNLRRQQTKAYTEEDRENAIARISNWRRTTFDGLTDSLQGKAAEENRAQLIDRLVEKFVACLEMNLCEPPPAGLENGARMIVENAVGISEKIPLESRDICVEYFMPGTLVNEAVMKIEGGLPPLTNVKQPPEGPPTRGSIEREGAHEGFIEDGDGESVPPSGGSNSMDGPPAGSTPGREQRMRSVFNTLMGKRQAPAVEASHGGKELKEPVEERSGGRIRFASFLSAEVRGRGPTNVLVKAPVYLI